MCEQCQKVFDKHFGGIDGETANQILWSMTAFPFADFPQFSQQIEDLARVIAGGSNRGEREGVVKLTVDNRDAGEMIGYLEARVEALKARIAELEAENGQLQAELAFERQCNALDEAVRG